MTLAGSSAQLLAGGKPVVLTATASANAGSLTWTLGAGSPGSLSATSGASVSYLPPPTRSDAASAAVTINVSGTGVSKSFSLTVYPDPGPAGLSLIAGNIGGYAQIDGTGDAARFLPIRGFDSDQVGNVFVVATETVNGSRNTIRKVTPLGVVSTILDSADGYVDGPLASARLSAPTSIALGKDGTLFVLDKNGIRTISSAGVVGTLTTAFNNNSAQPDPATGGYRDNSRTRIVTDGGTGLFVMERTLISKVSASGLASDLAGVRESSSGAVDGVGAAARFVDLRDIGFGGDLFAIDGHTVRKITLPYAVVETVGRRTNDIGGPNLGGVPVQLVDPVSIGGLTRGYGAVVLDETSETIDYSEPYGALRLRALRTVQYNTVPIIKTGLARVDLVRWDSGGRFLLAGNGEIQQIVNGAIYPLAGMGDDTVVDVDARGADARLMRPEYIAADPSGAIYVVETNEDRGGDTAEATGLRLRKIAADGNITTLSSRTSWWGAPGVSTAPVTKPGGIAVDRHGNLYISEISARNVHGMRVRGGSIVKITPGGVASVFAGKHDEADKFITPVDGAADAARFGDTRMIGIDADDNLYVDDGAIRKITPGGVVTTVSALPPGFGADAEGNVYVRDGSTVTRVAPDDTRTVVAGMPGQPGNKLGALPGNLYGGNLARTGPASFAVISGSAILKLVLPH